MARRIDYEWACNITDSSGDILESFIEDSYAEARQAQCLVADENSFIELWVSYSTEAAGLIDREFYTVREGRLPKHLPKHIAKQLAH